MARLTAMPGVADTAISVHPGLSFEWTIPKAVVPIAYFIAEGEKIDPSLDCYHFLRRCLTYPRFLLIGIEDPAWDPKLAADVEAWKTHKKPRSTCSRRIQASRRSRWQCQLFYFERS